MIQIFEQFDLMLNTVIFVAIYKYSILPIRPNPSLKSKKKSKLESSEIFEKFLIILNISMHPQQKTSSARYNKFKPKYNFYNYY